MNGAKGDLIFVIFAIIAIGIVWFSTGGVDRARLNPGAFLKPPQPLGSGETYGSINIRKTSVEIDFDKQNEITKVQSDFDKIKEELKDAQENDGFSEFESKITIKKNSYGPAMTSPEDEYLTLSASRNNNEKISITGWKLESMISGKQVVIGGATEVFISGVINSEPDAKLAPGETAIILTGRSPIGVSFKINKCTGYFEQFQDFSPSLSRRCPSSINEFDSFATIPVNDFTCEDIIRRVGTCEMPLESLPIGTSNECSIFISNNINYTGCVKNHRNDIDFLGDEWRIFLGRNEEIWRKKREVIKLIDNHGKIVDTYTY